MPPSQQSPASTPPDHGGLAAIARKPFIEISKIPQARSERLISRAMSPREQRTQHMTTSAKHHSTLPVAANDRSGPDASPRIKLYKRGIAILHADPQAGERLLAEALGAADRDALHGLLKQLVKASVTGRKPDEANLAFMISLVKSIAPKDSIEAMLAVQMASVHAATMRSACRLALTDDVPQQESLTRALTRLAPPFASQIEALSRHRNNGERAITVRNLSVADGGRAGGGKATQPHRQYGPEPPASGAGGPVPPREAGEYERAESRQGSNA